MMPAISVIIPAFNRARLVERALKSVLAQTFKDFEIIVVDDGSTEDLGSACPALDHRQVRYIRQENRGPALARNAGVEAAKGELVSFLDSDDTFLASNLEILCRLLQRNPSADIAHGWAVTVDGAGREAQWTRPRLEGLVYRHYLFSNPTPMGTLLVRRKCLGAGQLFDPRLALLEDWDFWLRLSLKHAFVYAPAVVARIQFQDLRRNSSRPASVVGDTVRTIYAKLLSDPSTSAVVTQQRRYLEANIHVVAGHHYRLYTKDLAAARREFIAALQLAPDFRPAHIGLVESFLGTRFTNWLRVARARIFSFQTRDDPFPRPEN